MVLAVAHPRGRLPLPISLRSFSVREGEGGERTFKKESVDCSAKRKLPSCGERALNSAAEGNPERCRTPSETRVMALRPRTPPRSRKRVRSAVKG